MTVKSLPILVVDDDEWERLCLELILNKKGYSMTGAESGREASDLISRDYFPVLIMDLFLSDMLSFEIIPTIKALHPSPKVILVTGEMREEYRQKASEIGVDAYLNKPINPKELYTILDQFSLPA